MLSADAQRLLHLQTQALHYGMVEQHLEQMSASQEAALVTVTDNVATLEKQNIQLRQCLLTMLRTSLAKADSEADSKAASTDEVVPQNSREAAEQHPRLHGWPEDATTVLICNIPPRSKVEDLLRAFPPDGSYDLLHLPFVIKARRTSSFVTINFTSPDLAADFYKRFSGQQLPHSARSCKDPMLIMPAHVQGLEANLAFLQAEKGISDMRNTALLPRLYLAGAVAERLASMEPSCVEQPDDIGQPHRLNFRQVLGMLNNTEA